MPTRRAALAALFAVGLHLALVGRARAEVAGRRSAGAHRVELAQRRGTEDPEQIRRPLGQPAGGAAAAPGARHAALAVDVTRAARTGAGALRALAGAHPRATRAGAPALASFPRAVARAAAARARRLSQLQEAHAGAAPPPARALAERHAGRTAALAGAAPRAARRSSRRPSYCVLGPRGRLRDLLRLGCPGWPS